MFLTALVGLMIPHSCLAVEEFDTSFILNYTVNPDASVSVVQSIDLTNKLTNVYATEYKITIGTTRVSNVWANDPWGRIEPEISNQEKDTSIKLLFNDKIVGRDQTLSFSLGYTSFDLAQKNGRVLEIAIPKITDSQTLQKYTVTLLVPRDCGSPLYILPQPTLATSDDNFNIYKFNKEQAVGRSITASFGDVQVFDFRLNYNLRNGALGRQYVEIALPPDTPFQKIYLDSLTPLPENIYVDSDGNWLAQYRLKVNQTLRVKAQGKAVISAHPQEEYKTQPLNAAGDYLRPLLFWESDNAEIQKLAQELKTTAKIFDFVSSTLTYDYESLNQDRLRLGAVEALKQKNSAVCTEFTDLFVALCRAAGIPSREVNGYAHTTNPSLRPISLERDVLHSWPQYYDFDKQLWIDVDPTWTHTTGGVDFYEHLDLNHFSFVYHGQRSDYPLTPGAYRNDDDKGKDIEVLFGDDPVAEEEYKISLEFPRKFLSGQWLEGTVSLENQGNISLREENIRWRSIGSIRAEGELHVDVIPPFGSFKKKVRIAKSNLLSQGEAQLQFSVKDEIVDYRVEVISPFSPGFVIPSLTVVTLILFMLFLRGRQRR